MVAVVLPARCTELPGIRGTADCAMATGQTAGLFYDAQGTSRVSGSGPISDPPGAENHGNFAQICEPWQSAVASGGNMRAISGRAPPFPWPSQPVVCGPCSSA